MEQNMKNNENQIKIISISCGNEIIKFHINVNDFHFHDFDCWVKSRFCISSSTEQVIYKKSDGTECMPGLHFFQYEDYIEIERKQINHSLFHGNHQYQEIMKKVQCGTVIDEDYNTFLIVIIAATAIYLYSQGVVSVASLTQWCDTIEDKMISMGFFSKKGVALESFVSCICWSIPYLFIRRMCNPETSKTALKKYSADAVFGGLAAGVTVLLKSMLVATMNR